MLVVSAIALYVIQNNVSVSMRAWMLIGASTLGTVFVMGILHAKLQRLYNVRAESEQKAHQDARIDSLTGVGNRKHITEIIDKACAEAGADPEMALLLMDLNGFKQVNDTLGHQYGDELIKAVARRIEGWIPGSDMGRLGGDEFAILVNAKDEEELTAQCEKMSKVFAEPFKLPGGPRKAGGGVGACLITNRNDSSDSLWHADLALYAAKQAGKPYRIFDEAMSKLEDRTKRLKADLESSLKTGAGLFVEFQPIVSTLGRDVAMEALLRWDHPELGLIRPLEIVAIAEKSQLIAASERFVARQVMETAKLHQHLRFCLNVSGLQLLDDKYAKWLETTARANGVKPSQFIIEVTESAIAERLPQFAAAITCLNRMGCQIAVDNFGKGHVSIPEVQRKGVTVVKIDRVVLLDAQEQRNISVLRASVELAKALKMTVVATGIDSANLESIARQAGCDWIQGYHLGEPTDLSANSRLKAAA